MIFLASVLGLGVFWIIFLNDVRAEGSDPSACGVAEGKH